MTTRAIGATRSSISMTTPIWTCPGRRARVNSDCPGDPTGACCDEVTGSCSEDVTEADCTASGFRYGGDGSTCATIDPPCEAPAIEVYLNEIFASHAGTDDQEFIELIGTPDGSLANIMVLVVEGDGAGSGNLDRAWDLSGNLIPADGYFVLGVDAVVNTDYNIGTDNAIENGTETFYLLDATDVSAVTALLGTDLDTDDDGVYDAGLEISGLGTILDVVAMVDGGYGSGDQIYDGATAIGPDGTFFPAGIFRDADYPGDWCDSFLDYDDDANLAQPRTPGEMNVDCPAIATGVRAAMRRPARAPRT